MKFIWAGTREKKNSRLIFELTLKKECDTLTLCAADFYRVFFDGVFQCYGPERTAAGYSRKKVLSLKGVKQIRIEVAAYNVRCYVCDYQLPFFGAELTKDNQLIYNSYQLCFKSFKIIN